MAVGSRDVLRAEAFIRDVVGPAAKDRQCQAYASYEGVWNDPVSLMSVNCRSLRGAETPVAARGRRLHR